MMDKLAIDGGMPVIREKLPQEFPGAYWMGKEEEKAVAAVVRAQSPFRYYGKNLLHEVDKFEKECKRFYGVRYALGVNSGTGALTASMAALGIGPGMEVILPGYMWISTVSAVVSLGAIPVLCEIDETLTMDPADLRKKITRRTKLIVPVHMAGVPSDMKRIMKAAKERGIPVIEDCAQCNGGGIDGKKVGTFGDIGIFSLQLNKNITTGEGGVLITNSARLYNRAFACHDLGFPRIEGRLVVTKIEDVLWGQGRRMSELTGAVGRVQLRKLPRIVSAMRKSKERIKEGIKDIPGISFRRIPDGAYDTGPFLIIYLPAGNTAKKFADAVVREGISGACWLEDHGMHNYFNMVNLVKKKSLSKYGCPWKCPENKESVYEYKKGALPATDKLLARGVLIPVPSILTERQELLIIKAVRKVAEKIH